jgi:hypothetical protein
MQPASRKLQTQFVTNRQPDFTAFKLGHSEICDSLVIKTDIPTNWNVVLGLGFFESLVVVRLDLDKRSEDVLILIRVLVPVKLKKSVLFGRVITADSSLQEDWLQILVTFSSFRIFQFGIRIRPPQFLETIQLLEPDISGSHDLILSGRLD